MRKLLTTIFILSFVLTPFAYTFAQEEPTDENQKQFLTEEDIQMIVLEEDEVNTEETSEERPTLSDTLNEESSEEIQRPPPRSFLTILGAILIPSIFIIICYIILKFFKF